MSAVVGVAVKRRREKTAYSGSTDSLIAKIRKWLGIRKKR
jgi:hypothetical protein